MYIADSIVWNWYIGLSKDVNEIFNAGKILFTLV